MSNNLIKMLNPFSTTNNLLKQITRRQLSKKQIEKAEQYFCKRRENSKILRPRFIDYYTNGNMTAIRISNRFYNQKDPLRWYKTVNYFYNKDKKLFKKSIIIGGIITVKNYNPPGSWFSRETISEKITSSISDEFS